MNDCIPLLILIARPAAGKSEIIAYLKELDSEERADRFRIGEIHRIDDFPMLWTWFEEDQILEEMGKSRIYTDASGFFLHHYLWDLLIRRISLEYDKLRRDLTTFTSSDLPGGEVVSPDAVRGSTVIIEFSRGSEHGGFRRAFEHLSETILANCAILYLDVSYEESFRKNQRRFNPEKPDSILEHGLPAEKMEALYRDSDWKQLVEEAGCSDATSEHTNECGTLRVKGHAIPYAIFANDDDVTTTGGEALGSRLEETIARLIRAK